MREFLDSVGFRFIHFAALNICIIAGAIRINRCIGPSGKAERLLRIFLLFMAQIVLLILLHGLSDILNLYKLTGTVLLFTLLVFMITKRILAHKCPAPDLPAEAAFGWFERAIIFIAAAVFIFGFYIESGAPPLGTDAYIYHLTFPVQWIKAGSLVRTATVFHEPAPTYSPMNGEFFYTWLLMPLKTDILAANGQFVFLPFAGLAMLLILKRIGLSRRFAVALAAFFFLSKPFFQELDIAYVDLISLSFYLGAVYFLLNLKNDFNTSILFFGISLGLFMGTKYINLIYLAALGPLILFSFLQRRKTLPPAPCKKDTFKWIAAALVCFFALCAYSYVRNYMETGNPLFPSDFTLFGRTIFKGMFDPARLMAKESGLPGVLAVFILASDAYSLPPVVGAVLSLLSIIAILKAIAGRKFGLFLVAISPFVSAVLYFYLVPFRDHRLLFPLYAGLYVNAGIALSGWLDKKPIREIIAILLVLLAFFEMNLVTKDAIHLLVFLATCAALLVLITVVHLWRLVIRAHPSGVLKMATVMVLAALVIYFIFGTWKIYYNSYEAGRYKTIGEYWGDYGECWKWLHEAGDEAPLTLAYAGTQMIYPLYGNEFRNEVVYISVRKDEKTFFHDFDFHFDSRRKVMLVHEARELFYTDPDFQSWYGRLIYNDVEYILLAGKGAIELEWVEQNPKKFENAFSSGDVRLIRVL